MSSTVYSEETGTDQGTPWAGCQPEIRDAAAHIGVPYRYRQAPEPGQLEVAVAPSAMKMTGIWKLKGKAVAIVEVK